MENMGSRSGSLYELIAQFAMTRKNNDFSIGIELEGSDTVPFADAQYTALIRLTRLLQRVYPIRDIVGHSDIAPGRKTDPGPFFDWARYRKFLM